MTKKYGHVHEMATITKLARAFAGGAHTPPPETDDDSCVRFRVTPAGDIEVLRAADQAEFGYRQSVVLAYISGLPLPAGAEFVVGLHDRYEGADAVPGRLVFSKRRQDPGVLIPDQYAMLQYMGRLAVPDTFAWRDKSDAAFFIGSSTGSLVPRENKRLQACALAQRHPKDIFVGISSIVQMSEADLARDFPEYKTFLMPPIPQNLQYTFRYLISIDGNTAAWDRLPWILASNSLCIRVASDHECWYYPALAAADCLVEAPTVEALHDALVEARALPEDAVAAMVERAHAFVREWLSPPAHAEYMAAVLHEVAAVSPALP